MKKLFVFNILVLIVSISHVYAQTDFRPGYYISNENDTIFGLIDYRGDVRNSKICVYRADESSEPIIFQPFDIKSYRFYESKFYISKMVPDKDDEKPLFLEYLVSGIADLYYYRENNYAHYFIEKEGKSLRELKSEEKMVYVDGKPYLTETNRHIGVLKATFAECEDLYPEIDKAELSHESLIGITTSYHDLVCEDGEVCTIYEKKLPLVQLKFAPIIGLNISNLNFKNPNSIYSVLDYKLNGNFTAGLKLNITLPRLNEKLSFMTEVLFERNYFYSNSLLEYFNTDYYHEVHVRFVALKNTYSLNYTYPKGKLRPTINIGGLLYFILDQNTKRITEVVSSTTIDTYEYHDKLFDNSNSGFTIGLGADYYLPNKKIIFFLSSFDYISGVNLQDHQNVLSENYNITTISIKTGIHF